VAPPGATIKIRFNKLAKRIARSGFKKKVLIEVTFTPDGGLPSMQNVKLKVKPKRKGK
jgi:hypothetical protein